MSQTKQIERLKRINKRLLRDLCDALRRLEAIEKRVYEQAKHQLA